MRDCLSFFTKSDARSDKTFLENFSIGFIIERWFALRGGRMFGGVPKNLGLTSFGHQIFWKDRKASNEL